MKLILLFVEGLTSALSPCVLPILPLYMGYLSQNAKQINEDGTVSYKRSIVLLYTLFFVLGITMTFFVLTLTMVSASNIFSNYKLQFTVLGGVFVFLMGLVQLGVIEVPFLMKEHRLPKIINPQNMNLFTAFLMGFLFSFAWTPCIGPALSGVLVMASTAETVQGILMILVYASGFLIPFLILGLFTAEVLKFIKEKKNIMNYTIKAGGIILLCMGVFMMNEGFNLATITQEANNPELKSQYDFILEDQFGNTHQLSEYEGKPVMLSFIATWCTYCKQEMEHIQKVYTEDKDIQVLTIIQLPSEEISKEEVIVWMKENKYSFPVLFDETGSTGRVYGVTGFPFTFFVQPNGEFLGYVPGYVDEATLTQILGQLKASE